MIQKNILRKKHIYAIFFAFSTLSVFGQITYNKPFKSSTGLSCKLIDSSSGDDGGCSLYYYKTLIFNKDKTVKIISEIIYSCSPKEFENSYKNKKPTVTTSTYELKDKKIFIKDFEYSPLLINNKELKFNENIIFK
ncbi:hypothetical protein [Empedobacter sedimenti]|uniref:hypothetical protein n=1 Tax=Empedobacter sedimenti TaxID=3042610 RepID=UPI0024A64513|nr:hypothetical protein [Empedobacter sedimenti]